VKTVAMANRAVEVIELFELDEEKCTVSMAETRVKVNVNAVNLTQMQRAAIETGSGYASDNHEFVRSVEGNIYEGDLILTQQKELTEKHGFSVVLSVNGWLKQSMPKTVGA